MHLAGAFRTTKQTHMAVELWMVEEAIDGDGPVIWQNEQVILLDKRSTVVIRYEDGRRRVGALWRISGQAHHHVRSFSGPVNRQHKVRVIERKLSHKIQNVHVFKGY